MFDEFGYPASNLIDDFEVMVMMIANKYKISFKDPPHDMARRFLNEIKEFEPLEEDPK